MTKRLSAWVVIIGLVLLLEGRIAYSAEPKAETGFQVGDAMPFHVVDFLKSGPKSGGCPSVMISNTKKLGVEIWSRSVDDATFRLAGELQHVIPSGKRPNIFLMIFDKPSAKVVAERSKKVGLEEEKFLICSPRSSASKLIVRADPGKTSDTFVFVEKRKIIKAAWRFPEGGLDQAAIRDVVAKTKRLLAEEKQN